MRKKQLTHIGASVCEIILEQKLTWEMFAVQCHCGTVRGYANTGVKHGLESHEPKILKVAGQYPQLVSQEVEHRALSVQLSLAFILINVSV